MTAIRDTQKAPQDLMNDSRRGLFRVLHVLAWAIVPTAILSGLLGLSYLGSDSSLLNMVILLIFIFPAAWICETLGLGTLSFLGGTTPSAMWPIMVALAYIYGLVLVLVIRGFWRLISSTGRRIGRSA